MLREDLPEPMKAHRATIAGGSSSRDVVVTGMGAITPAGRGVHDAWEGVLAGKTAAAHDDMLAEQGSPVTISARVPAFDADAEMGRGSARRLDRFTHLAVMATAEALDQAGLLPADVQRGSDGRARLTQAVVLTGVDGDRVGVMLGSGIGGAETWASEYENFFNKGPARVSPMFIPKMLSNTAAGIISMRTGARGPNMTVNTACAAGASAIHLGRDMIRAGSADVVIVGGVEAGITTLAVSAFAQMTALTKNPDPATASRPFDADRSGFVMGEGAGILVLESREHAEARGATPLAVIAGCGASADAHHQTAPPQDGAGAVLAMSRAIADAGIDPSQIGHVNAHGTSTPLNDAAESRAINTVFGEHAARLSVSSTKGVTGHLLGAAGGVEAIFAIQALREGLVPPTANFTTLGDGIELDIVHGAPRRGDLHAVLSNSFGFGGQNASLLFMSVPADWVAPVTATIGL
ncbi:MAG: 3-oxoacyl-[acyl-carrier-protein] synthase II [Glaciecola sp.]|jgi:3-oxoacyl-[acyl-carrier-protein] synthase II